MSDFDDEMMADPFYAAQSLDQIQNDLYVEFQEEQYALHKSERDLEDY